MHESSQESVGGRDDVGGVGGYALAEAVTGIKKATLYALVHQRRIPHVRLSARLVRFRRAELEAWLDRHAVAADGG